MLYLLDLVGTFAFAITGAYKAKGARLHIFGVVFLGIITAVGGGTFRDVAIGRTPLFYFQDANYLLVAILAGVVIYFAPTFFAKQYSLFRFIDSVGLAAFVIIGVSVANLFLFGGDHFSLISLLVSVFLGMLTGFGGGIIRDAIMGGVPLSLTHGSNYVSAAFWGALSFYLLKNINESFAILVSFAITLILREVVSKYGIYNRLIKNNKNGK